MSFMKNMATPAFGKKSEDHLRAYVFSDTAKQSKLQNCRKYILLNECDPVYSQKM